MGQVSGVSLTHIPSGTRWLPGGAPSTSIPSSSFQGLTSLAEGDLSLHPWYGNGQPLESPGTRRGRANQEHRSLEGKGGLLCLPGFAALAPRDESQL